VILAGLLGPVYSNIPLQDGHGLPAPPDAHVCLDLGEEEFTKGRPHPMIDPAARREILQRDALRPEVAVVLLDVVLGYGSHPDPAGEIAGTCADIVSSGAAVIAHVLGTRADPQGYDSQRAKLADAGVILTATAAGAARTAAAIAARRPELAALAAR
jgi:FdrA protein